jgi:hypothetical protein
MADVPITPSSYPEGDEYLVPPGVDLNRYRSRLINDSRRLFVSHRAQLEIFRFSQDGSKQCYRV